MNHMTISRPPRQWHSGAAIGAITAVTVALVAAGCGDERLTEASAAGSPEGAHIIELDGGTVAVVNEETDGFMDAQVEGLVSVVDGTPCWGMTDHSGETFIVVWPYGTTSTDDGEGLQVSPEVTLRRGDQLLSSGGYVTPDTVTGLNVEDVCGDVDRIVLAKEFSPAT